MGGSVIVSSLTELCSLNKLINTVKNLYEDDFFSLKQRDLDSSPSPIFRKFYTKSLTRHLIKSMDRIECSIGFSLFSTKAYRLTNGPIIIFFSNFLFPLIFFFLDICLLHILSFKHFFFYIKLSKFRRICGSRVVTHQLVN